MVRFEVAYLITALITLFLLLCFIPIFWMKNTLPKWVFWPVFALPVLAFVALDIVYNVVVGSLLFWELPREALFTNRLKRWDAVSDPRVARFARVLNYFDPGHV